VGTGPFGSYEIVRIGEPPNDETVAPLVVSTALRSNTDDEAWSDGGADTDVGTTVTATFAPTIPGANVTVALPSALPALPPASGVTSDPAGGERPLPGVAAGSSGGSAGACDVSPVEPEGSPPDVEAEPGEPGGVGDVPAAPATPRPGERVVPPGNADAASLGSPGAIGCTVASTGAGGSPSDTSTAPPAAGSPAGAAGSAELDCPVDDSEGSERTGGVTGCAGGGGGAGATAGGATVSAAGGATASAAGGAEVSGVTGSAGSAGSE